MREHHITYYIRKKGGKHYGSCDVCGWMTGDCETKIAAMDKALQHDVQVARIRAANKPRTVKLEDEHKWQVQQANDPENSKADRALWRQLADETARRLGLDAPQTEDQELPFG